MRQTEAFWQGEFGNEYTERNRGRIEINKRFFTRAFMAAEWFDSLIEFGAGSGENLMALNELAPKMTLVGVDINPLAYQMLEKNLDKCESALALQGSFLNMTFPKYDCAMTKGVLIHMAPEDLQTAYEKLYETAGRYILIAEYFSPEPREIEYRQHAGKLWTRDFGGEMLDKYPDLKLLDVSFHYNRTTGQDNITAWLMEKDA